MKDKLYKLMKMKKNVKNIADRIQLIEIIESEYCKIKKEIEEEIDKLENIDQKRLLKYRYIDCMPWNEVASKLGYSRGYIFKIRDAAIENLENNNNNATN